MGKQIRFFALPADEMVFLNFVSSIPDSYRVSSKSPDSSVASFLLPWSKDMPKPVFRDYYIGKGNPKSLVPYVREGSTKEYSAEVMDYVEIGERFYWIDMNAPLVEYSSSFIRGDGKLIQGRIWADFYRLEGHEFVYKGDEFKNLFETLTQWIRKNFKRKKGVDGYFGKEAFAWHEAGGIVFQ